MSFLKKFRNLFSEGSTTPIYTLLKNIKIYCPKDTPGFVYNKKLEGLNPKDDDEYTKKELLELLEIIESLKDYSYNLFVKTKPSDSRISSKAELRRISLRLHRILEEKIKEM